MANSADYAFEVYSTIGVALRIKENFGVPHTFGGGAPQIRNRQIVKILLSDKRAGALIIEIEK